MRLGKFMVATYSVGQLLWLRACAALLLLAPMIWRQRRQFLQLERPRLQLFRVVLSTLEVAAFFLATVYLPLADVVTYYLACPIFVTALSAHRAARAGRLAALERDPDRLCGVLIALRPSSQSFSWPALIALSGSLSFAVLMLITRSLRSDARHRDGDVAIRRHLPARRGDVAVRLGAADAAKPRAVRRRGPHLGLRADCASTAR